MPINSSKKSKANAILKGYVLNICLVVLGKFISSALV
jgi:hypothetical protein